MLKKAVSCFALLCVAVMSFAQTRVSGTVTDSEGVPMPGVSVVVSGTSMGTATDVKGAYTLTVKEGDVLQFVLFGMMTENIPFKGQKTIDVVLKDDTLKLDEVVVTASGMTRQEKTLGYASTTVRSDELTKGHAADALSGLMGKVAGVQISSAGATGTSQKVIVRGYSSLTGSNQPLYVVDGVPMSNSTSGVQDLNNSIDFGSQGADINPEDVLSITVLKGASATALYGSRAGNGAIIITTKRGQQNEDVKVTYNGSFQVSQALRIPATQNRFGQGWYYDYDGSYLGNYSYTENGSWGNRLDGRKVEWRPGAYWATGDEQYRSYTTFDYKENSLKNFYTTGFEANNSVSIQGGSKSTGFVASYGNIYSDGILPGNNDYYKRHNFSFRGNTKIKEGLAWLNYGLNYVRKDIRNAMTGQGGDGSTIFNDILQYPVNIDYGELKDYSSILNNADNFYTPYSQNPFWILDHNYSTYQDDRVYGNLEFGVQIIKGLQFIARGGMDISNNLQKTYNDLWKFNPGSYSDSEGASQEIGTYAEVARRQAQFDGNFLLNADYTIANDWSIHGVAGLNLNQRSSRYTSGSVQGLAFSNYPSFDNTSGSIPQAYSYESLRRLVGAYAQADFGWKDAVYLTLSARNDWSSTLPVQNQSYFYWGANGSVILTSLIPGLQNSVIDFLKIRGGYGQTGNDASPYLTSSYYYLASASGGFGSLVFPLDGYSGLSKSSRIPSTDLKPEISTEAELGLDLRMFDNRVSVDLALYNKVTRNQIISATLAPESGYTSTVRNVGQIRNKGIELAMGFVPVRSKNFTWNIGYTFSKNVNTVDELWDGLNEYSIYGLSNGPQLKAIVGQSVSTWVDYPVKTVEDKNSPYYGYTIVNATTGYPTYDNTKYETIGTADPEFTMGLNNNFKIGDLSIGFSLDWRHGGLMYSASSSILYFTGNAEETMYNDRDAWVEPHAVYVGSDGNYHENNIPVNAYYNLNGIWYSNYNYVRYRDSLIDKGYLKLRELNVTYALPHKWFENLRWLSSVDLSLIGRNLLMWTPNQGIIDPDVTNYGNDLTSNYGEYYGAPSTRNYGFSVKVVF